MCRQLFVFFIFFHLCFFGKTQSNFGGFENIGKREGMFHVNTRTIYSDSRGFMWIGTSDGLMRYDGVIFDLFRRSKQDTTALSDNAINCIIEDANDYVFWIGTALGGLNRFDITKNKYSYFYIEPESFNSKGVVQIQSLYQISEDCFLVGTMHQGLYLFYPSLHKFVPLKDIYTENQFQFKGINQIIEGVNYIWVTAAEGLARFDKNGKYLQKYFFTGESFDIEPVKKSRKIAHLIEMKDSSIVFTSGNKLFRYNFKNNTVEKLLQVENNIELNYIDIDNDGGYWIGSKNNGLFYLSRNGTIHKHLNLMNGEENNITNNQIQDLFFCHRQSILWVATRSGVSKYDYHKVKFKQHNLNKLTNGEVNNPYMIGKDSREGYWFWSQAGLYHKEKDKKYYTKFDAPENIVTYRMIEDENNNLWFASNQGLMQFNLNTGKTSLVKFSCPNCDSSRANFLTYLTPAENNHTWISSKTGLIKFNLKTYQYKVFPIDSGKNESIEYRFTALEYSKDKKYLWLVSRRGRIWRFDIEKEVFERYEIKENENLHHKPIVILDIEIDQNGKIWLATYGGGLLIYDPVSKSISDELAVELLESYVYGILSDNEGNFWMSSNFGISKVNVESKEITNYQEMEGAFCEGFNDKAYFKTKDGEFLFGGTNGFVEFNPDSLYLNKYNAKLYIDAYTVKNDVSTYGDDLYDDVVYLNDSIIEVDRTKAAIRFYISLLNFSHSEQNKMKWKLEGYDEQWKESKTRNVISYNNLKSGKYKLLVRGINNDGVESNKSAYLIVKIKARFYETLIFKILFVLIGIVILFILYKIRVSWYLIQEENLIRKVDEKTKELVLINEELEMTKEEILSQKVELEVHRNYLEELVNVRTKDLEFAKLKAEESDRLKTAFLANLSHEIRTPMNAIIGFSSLLQTDEFPLAQKNEFLKVIGQSSESLLVLINDIIDISRIETGDIQIEKQNVHIPSLIKATLDELVFEDKSENVRFMLFVELTPKDVEIYTDRYRLKQVLSNLIRNAFKFTDEGYVKLTVKTVKKEEIIDLGFKLSQNKYFRPILFVIEDTGIGIKQDDLKMIFEPFSKAKNGSKFYQGMGLGLSIVRNLLSLCSGDIIVKSELNKGTTFYFYINAFHEIKS